ncbi:hypothetical protein LguiB_007906 [Lonicera macranthoides]
MMEVKDQGIKLFGKKIALPENGNTPVFFGDVAGGDDSVEVLHENYISSDRDIVLMETNETCLEDNIVVKEGQEEEETEKDHLAEEHSETKPEESKNSKASPESDENPKTPSIDEESPTLTPPKTENDQSDTTNSQQKALKKPDKILPCPRCNSMDTKFCYYNNYNVNQPRHFCKSCQRYWTAGGTMRNVPVGAGRRKNKNSTFNCNHITISEALQAARIDAPNGARRPPFKTNGTVLSFNSGPHLPESMACVLNLAENKSPNGARNGEDCSSASSVTVSVSASTSMIQAVENGHRDLSMPNIHGYPSQVPYLPGVPWSYPWNSTVPMPIPSVIPVPFCPPPYWNCNVPGSWSINPWLSPPPTPNQKEAVVAASAPYSPTLGKHSRDGDLIKPSNLEQREPLVEKNSESCILIPKILRIDDPDEAAKSSIWETLGIKHDSVSRGGLFKAFERKGDEKNHVNTTSPVLQANPAAMSRSLSFQERA